MTQKHPSLLQTYHGIKLNIGFRMLLSAEQEAFNKLCEVVPCPDFNRAGTYTKCTICGCMYIEHPYLIPHTMLNLLCDGRVVKL